MGLWDVDEDRVRRPTPKDPKEDFAFHYYDADKVVPARR